MSWHGDINRNIGNAEANALTEHETELLAEYKKRIIEARQQSGQWVDLLSKTKKEAI